MGKDFKGNHGTRGVSDNGMVKVGLPPDPVVSERTIHDLILWVSSLQDISIPGFTSLQSIPEVNIFLSANMVLSFNLDAPSTSGPAASGGGSKSKGSGSGGGSSSSGSGGSISSYVEVEETGGSKVTVATLLTELGSQCSSSADAFVQMVKFLCTTQKFVYDEDQIAALIVEAVSYWSRPPQPGYGESFITERGFMQNGGRDGKGGMALSLLQNFMESEPGKDLNFDKEEVASHGAWRKFLAASSNATPFL